MMNNYTAISIFPSDFLQTLEDGLTGNTSDTWKRRKRSCSLHKGKSVIQPGTCPLTHEEERTVPTYKNTGVTTHTDTHKHTTNIHTYTCTHRHMYTHTQAYTHACTGIHTCTHRHTQMHTHTHTHTHTHNPPPPTHAHLFSKVLRQQVMTCRSLVLLGCINREPLLLTSIGCQDNQHTSREAAPEQVLGRADTNALQFPQGLLVIPPD